MNESTSALRGQMLAAADRLRGLVFLNHPAEHISTLLVTMQLGGEPATRAWACLHQETMRLPKAERALLEQRLADYQQSIGRWMIADSHARLSMPPFPATQSDGM